LIICQFLLSKRCTNKKSEKDLVPVKQWLSLKESYIAWLDQAPFENSLSLGSVGEE
jgi:hypothetical protein